MADLTSVLKEGAPLTEFVLESVIRDGLGELKTTPTKIDNIFARFLEAHFSNQYGQTKIDEIKTYIQNNQVKIVHAWQQVPFNAPCISISLIRADESEDLQNLGNEFLEEDENITPTILVPVVTPGTYDTTTGKLTVTNASDLSTVCPGLVFVDSSDQKFVIGSGNSNISGNKFINIGTGQSPNLVGDGRIESSIDFKRTDRRMVRIRETLHLGCHATNDLHLSKFIYYILVYILKSRQKSLITRGIELDRGTGSVFDREDKYEGENVYSRFLEVNCITDFIWDQSEVNLVDCFDPTIKAEDEDGNKFNVNTSE